MKFIGVPNFNLHLFTAHTFFPRESGLDFSSFFLSSEVAVFQKAHKDTDGQTSVGPADLGTAYPQQRIHTLQVYCTIPGSTLPRNHS